MELCEVVPKVKIPLMIQYSPQIANFFFGPGILLIILVAAVAATFMSVRLFGQQISLLVEEILVRIPFLRSYFMDKAILELSASMSSYLDDGRDLKEALEFSMSACSHPWLKGRLKKCLSKVERGSNWLDAWQEMRLGMPIDEMALRNAAAKEDISSGFKILMEWHYRRALRVSKHIALLLFISAIAFNATLVVFMATGIFGSFAEIINEMASW